MATSATKALSKSDLVDAIAKETGETKAAVARVIDSFQDVVTTTLKKGGSVALIGFGSFKVSKRAARTGRNPSTGEEIKIAASKVARFAPGASLKTALNAKK